MATEEQLSDAERRQRCEAERPQLEAIAKSVFPTEDFRKRLASQRPAPDDEFLVLVTKREMGACVALGVRILELWEERKTGKIELTTFHFVMMNLTEWIKTKDFLWPDYEEGLWLQYCGWLHECPFYVPDEVITYLSNDPRHQLYPELVL
jgi:hypothetical protein